MNQREEKGNMNLISILFKLNIFSLNIAINLAYILGLEIKKK